MRNHASYILNVHFMVAMALAESGGAMAYEVSPGRRVGDDGLPRLHCLQTDVHWTGADSMHLALSFNAMVDRKLHGHTAIHLQPMVLIGKDTLRYPELIYGKRVWRRFDKRRLLLNHRVRPDGTLVYTQRRRPSELPYSEAIRIPGYTGGGRLIVSQYMETCCEMIPLGLTEIDMPDRRPVVVRRAPVVAVVDTGLPAPVAVLPLQLFEANVSFLEPEREELKEREESVQIRVTFPVNQSDIRPAFMGNAAELARVDRLLAPMQSHSAAYQIKTLSVVGYTSPEGTYKHNMDLSVRRATSMSRYLKDHFPFMRNLYIGIEGKGEDWTGLLGLVEGSGMPYEEEVAHLIRTVGVFNGLESRLAALHGGMPYRYMLRNFFPQLRRMELRMAYSVRTFVSAEEVDALLVSRPQDLSHAEIYDAARRRNSDATLSRSRADYGHEFDLALGLYPTDVAAQVNASSAALLRGDMVRARVLLSPLKDHPRAANNVGIYYWLCGRTDRARQYFVQARAVDPTRADHNLQALDQFIANPSKNHSHGSAQ